MAADYKKLLINYIDKIVFVGFLVLFLVVAFKVVMSGPRTGTSIPPMPTKIPPPGSTIYKERFVLNRFLNPPEPDATHDFTSDPEKTEPGLGEKQCPVCGWIVQRTVPTCPRCGYSWHGIQRIEPEEKNNEKPKPPLPPGVPPFRVLEIARRPVDILFKGYSKKVMNPSNPIKRGEYDLQINWGEGETSFVLLGESFHGYDLWPLEKKEEMRQMPGISRPRKLDIYYLTIKKPGEDALVVEKGKTVRENEAVATLDGGDTKWKVEHRDVVESYGESTFDVYGEFELTEIGGEGRKYKVLVVTDTEVVLQDEKQGKEFKLSREGT